MLTAEEFGAIFQMDEDIMSVETEVEEVVDGSTDGSDSDDDMSEDEREWVMQNRDSHNTYGGRLYMDVMRVMGWSMDVYPGVGTFEDPIDMTDA